MAAKTSTGARTRARELALQALYQKQIADHDLNELRRQFREQVAYDRVDQAFFDETLSAIVKGEDELAGIIDRCIDRPRDHLDPVEYGVLLIGTYELSSRIEIPYRVVINEGVNLAKRFGALDGHKYINACLDKAAQELRQIEIKGGL